MKKIAYGLTIVLVVILSIGVSIKRLREQKENKRPYIQDSFLGLTIGESYTFEQNNQIIDLYSFKAIDYDKFEGYDVFFGGYKWDRACVMLTSDYRTPYQGEFYQMGFAKLFKYSTEPNEMYKQLFDLLHKKYGNNKKIDKDYCIPESNTWYGKNNMKCTLQRCQQNDTYAIVLLYTNVTATKRLKQKQIDEL